MNGSPTGRSAVVVGGGIGGLAAALGLKVRSGWHVTVLERAPELGEVGAGLSLWTNALRALDQLGVGEQVRAGGLVEAAGGLRTRSGRWLTRLDTSTIEQSLGTAILAVHRAELHRILRSPLPAECLVTGAEVTSVEPGSADGAPAVVHYTTAAGSAAIEADLVVAADGMNSGIRTRLWPQAPGPVYSGATAWRGVTREGSLRPLMEFGQTWGPGEEFGSLPLTDGRVYWYAAVNAPAGERHPDPLAEVRRRFGHWHDPIPGLLDATDPGAVLRHDMFELATPLATYVHGRVALLGDAAHAMLPTLGQGACQAIEDAVVLAAAVASEPTLDAALTRYDRERRPRTQAIVRTAHQIWRVGQRLDNPVAVALRNAAIRFTPPRLGLRMMVRVADWTPPPLEDRSPANSLRDRPDR